MIIFLYGPDDYRRLEKKREILTSFLKKHSAIGVGVFDMETDGAPPPLERLAEFARNHSLFESAKLAVLENAFGADADRIAKVLKPFVDGTDTTILISELGKPVKALGFLLRAPVRTEEFRNLEGVEWAAFIKSEAKKLGLSLQEAAAQFLGTVYKDDPWGLVTELQKLSALVPAGASIQKKDLDALDLEAAPNYWALLNGLKSYDGRIRLSALETLFSINDPAAKIFNILSAQAAEKTPRMAEYDLAVKSGKLDYEEVLLDLTLG